MGINDLSDVLPDIAREYFFYARRNVVALPKWLQPHFDGVSIQDLIDNNMLRLRGLKRLDLSSKNIADLTGLQNIPGIQEVTALLLFDNSITTVAPGAFAGLSNLRRLALGNNQITTIAPDTFADLPNLQDLALGNNQITTIVQGTFADLPNLEQLDMDNNQITTIAPGTFAGLPNFEHLGLSNNNLSKANLDRIQDELGEKTRLWR
jgi:Leucine-rich repeat (LRR) protein